MVLGVTLLGSISVSVLATGALDVGLARLGLADGGVGAVVPAAAALVLGLGTGFLVFFWILTRLPRTAVPRRGVIRAALVGALGFEVLKQAAALSIGSVTGTPGGAVFGPLLGLLLFCYLVSRFALLVSAWAATARGNELLPAAAEPAIPAHPEPAPARPAGPVRPAAAIPVQTGAGAGRAVRPHAAIRRARGVARRPRRRSGRRHPARRLAARPSPIARPRAITPTPRHLPLLRARCSGRGGAKVARSQDIGARSAAAALGVALLVVGPGPPELPLRHRRPGVPAAAVVREVLVVGVLAQHPAHVPQQRAQSFGDHQWCARTRGGTACAHSFSSSRSAGTGTNPDGA